MSRYYIQWTGDLELELNCRQVWWTHVVRVLFIRCHQLPSPSDPQMKPVPWCNPVVCNFCNHERCFLHTAEGGLNILLPLLPCIVFNLHSSLFYLCLAILAHITVLPSSVSLNLKWDTVWTTNKTGCFALPEEKELSCNTDKAEGNKSSLPCSISARHLWLNIMIKLKPAKTVIFVSNQ